MDEESQMSTISTAEESTTAPDQSEVTKGNSKLFVGGAILLLAILGVVYFTGSFDAAKEKDIDSGADSEGGLSDDDSQPTYLGTRTTKRPQGTKQSTATLSKTTLSTTTLSTTTRSTNTGPTPDDFEEPEPTKRPVPKNLQSTAEDILLCTVSHLPIFNILYPEDGLCDLVFYTSIRYFRKKGKFLGAFETKSFALFRKKSKAASGKTGYGASFDYRYGAAAAKGMTKENIEELWKEGIHHYGVLHIWDNYAELTNNNPNLNVVKEVKKYQDVLEGKRKVHRAFGFQVKRAQEVDHIRDIIINFQINYPITILITITHVFKAPAGSFALGPSTWQGPLVPYPMDKIADEWKAALLREDIWLMPSYSMQIVHWKIHPKYQQLFTDFQLVDYEIVSYSPGVIEQVCRDNNATLDPKGYFMRTGVFKHEMLVTYDTGDTMINKTKLFFERVGHLPPRHGWALYDVSYDYAPHFCPGGTSFARLKQMSRFVRM